MKKKIILYTDNLYDENEKNNILKDTKIVIHVPSHENLHSFPWAKTCELMLKKVFLLLKMMICIYKV